MTFQFLIGRLDTPFRRLSPCLLSLFQFLIGRLDTWECGGYRCYFDAFQFLIGRLDTRTPINFSA